MLHVTLLDIDIISAGDIAAASGFKNVKSGDTLIA